jgi:hypothetical protein
MGAKEGTNQIELSEKGRAPRCSLALGEHFGNVKRRYQRGSCKRESRLRVRLHGLHEVPQRLSACAAVPWCQEHSLAWLSSEGRESGGDEMKRCNSRLGIP